jgi:N-methylhydantoinase B
VKLTLTFERHGCPPWGVLGGKPGKPGYVEIQRAGESEARKYLKATDVPLDVGDHVRIYTGGGGGYGDPLARDPELVALELRRGVVSPESALDDYGVMVDDEGRLDRDRTLAERARKRTQDGARNK